MPEHALGDDVAHDLVGAAFDAGAGRAQQHRLEFAGGFGVLGPLSTPAAPCRSSA
jgi:hypothetical protein